VKLVDISRTKRRHSWKLKLIQTPTVFWPGGRTISLGYWMYPGLMILGRQKCIQQSH